MVTRGVAGGGVGGWAAQGGVGILSCYARAAPRPTFVWTTEDGVTLAAPDKYIIHSTQVRRIVAFSVIVQLPRRRNTTNLIKQHQQYQYILKLLYLLLFIFVMNPISRSVAMLQPLRISRLEIQGTI